MTRDDEGQMLSRVSTGGAILMHRGGGCQGCFVRRISSPDFLVLTQAAATCPLKSRLHMFNLMTRAGQDTKTFR